MSHSVVRRHVGRSQLKHSRARMVCVNLSGAQAPDEAYGRGLSTVLFAVLVYLNG
jgi:hypothetical protein